MPFTSLYQQLTDEAPSHDPQNIPGESFTTTQWQVEERPQRQYELDSRVTVAPGSPRLLFTLSIPAGKYVFRNQNGQPKTILERPCIFGPVANLVTCFAHSTASLF